MKITTRVQLNVEAIKLGAQERIGDGADEPANI